MPQTLLTAREAIHRALTVEEIESVWSAAGSMPGDPDWAGGDVFQDARERIIAAPPDRVFDVLMRLGGRAGWLRYNRLWRLRGWLDRLAGGPGIGRGRRDPVRLSWGETVDFWRVTELDRDRRLTLRAEMRVPGDALLEFTLTPARTSDGSEATLLQQTARFRPRGLLGLAYWYTVIPFHRAVFDGLIAGIEQAARRVPPLTPG
jgi:uncharacterized protein YndB with AHSA1/START domain